MKIVFLSDYDIVNYKKPSMFIGFPKCSGKCNKINGEIVCQNEALKSADKIEISADEIVDLYIHNNIVKAIIFGGLEPFDTPEDLIFLVQKFREKTIDDIVIYTGYTEFEVKNMEIYGKLLQYSNIIIKYGRYIMNQQPHYDKILGVKLASNNQYARLISE